MYDRYALAPGATVTGPALIEERESTCVIGAGNVATVDARYNLVAELGMTGESTMSDKTFDAVSLGIMWDRLISIVDEIVSTLVRTSFSTIVNESYDLSCVRARRRGQLDRAGHLQRARVHRQRADHAAAHARSAIPPRRSSPAT